MKNYKTKLLSLIVSSIFIGCTTPASNSSDVSTENKKTIEVFKQNDIAKALINKMFYPNINDITCIESNSVYYLSYTKENTKYTLKVKFKGNEIIWGNKEGRWRDNQFDSQFKYSISDSTLTISEFFDQESSPSSKNYNKNEFD